MTPTEKVALGRSLEDLETPKARERQGHGQTAPGRNASDKRAEASPGRVRDIVGGAVGMSGASYERAKAIVEAAEQGNPNGETALEDLEKPKAEERMVAGREPSDKRSQGRVREIVGTAVGRGKGRYG